MKFPSLSQLKKDLSLLNEQELIELIAELSKFSRDNKAYLFFKLHEKDNPGLFLEMAKEELELEFQKANTQHGYYAKKSAQAIRRKMNKLLKLNKKKEDQAELILFFCERLKEYGYLAHRHPVIQNLYEIQIRKAEKLISGLHEDLQYDFQEKMRELA
ncbi:hypothetical protein OU792_17870 [Algoriphagus sp. NF]|jgi:hypothetical protein|uniref:hypothetical protein n=1 Tax=Algoriphagus sp. NF TaxID=2992756 RepID=UPI0010659D8D|nr:hypothetical protein [Algoriphagus sp. NF]MDE0561870.1 hypothetical protein [Algoriphagus sp. NF]